MSTIFRRGTLYNCVCVFFRLFYGGRGFVFALSVAGQAREAWVHNNIPGMSGSRPSTIEVLGALHVNELALQNKELLSATPSGVSDSETTKFLIVLFKHSAALEHLFSSLCCTYCFNHCGRRSSSRRSLNDNSKNNNSINQQQHTSVGR